MDAVGATRALSEYMDGLSTWYLRLSRRRFSRSDDSADQAAAFATLHEALVAGRRMLAPILPFVTDAMYQNLVVAVDRDAPDSVHLTAYPTADLAAQRDNALEATMAIAQRAVDLARGLRSSAELKIRQPLATAWIALPDRGLAVGDELLTIVADEINVKTVEIIADGSDLVERRVKPLLPKIGKRLGSAIPAVMSAARDGEVTFEADGSVTLAGVTLAPDEVEIQATPRPGTAVAHDDGLVVVIDTALTPELRAEGDARDIQRAVQDLRRDAGLDLDERVDLWIDGADAAVEPYLLGVAADTLGDLVAGADPGRRDGARDRGGRLGRGPDRLAPTVRRPVG